MKDELFFLLVFAALIAGFAGNSMARAATTPSWNDTPAALREAVGVRRQGDWLFATGVATAIQAESGKANELARKRSLFEALKLIRFAATCTNLADTLPEKDREPFLMLYADLAPDISIRGLTTIKQWEKNAVHFTAVAVPIASVAGNVCVYTDPEALFADYLQSGIASPAGLDFALARISRHTMLYREIREAVSKWYARRDAGRDNPITLCLSGTPPKVLSTPTPLGEQLSLNRIDTAMKYVQLAERMQATGSEDSHSQAYAYVLMALDRAPFYSRPYLLLSDLFRQRLNKPAYALAAAEKGLRDGNSYHEAVQRMVAALNDLHSPEAEVFQYLLDRSTSLPENFDEKALMEYSTGSWGGEVDKIKEHSPQWLVLFSLGQAVTGSSKPPPPEFQKASELFGQAVTEEDFEKILSLLVTAVEKEPYCPETYNLIGTCYRYLKKPELALPFLWQALKLRPDYDFALTNLGLCCEQLGLLQSAGFYFNHEAVRQSGNAWVQSSYRKFKNIEQ